MKKFLLGYKIGMTQIMDEEGIVTPVTALKVGPCTVVSLIQHTQHGDYSGVVIGFDDISESKLTKPKAGFFKSKNCSSKRHLKQFSVKSTEGYEVNQELKADIFEANEKVDVRSKSIGRGFTGTIRRHNFGRGPMTHGSKSHRIPGSIGAGTDPSRVFKGTKMGGHYGDELVTIKNLVVAKVDLENNVLYIKGAVPGKRDSLVEIFVK